MLLQARLVTPSGAGVIERVSPYQYSNVSDLLSSSLPLSFFYLHSYVSRATSDSFLLTLKTPLATPGNSSISLSLNDDPSSVGAAIQVAGSPIAFEVSVTEIASVALVAPASLEAGLALAVSLSVQVCSTHDIAALSQCSS